MEILTYDHAKHQYVLTAFGDIHVSCMEHDTTVATILTYGREKATKIYRAPQPLEIHKSTSQTGRCTMIFGMASVEDGRPPEVVGYVTLVKPDTETGQFRGSVQKLMVSPRYRKKGAARALMDKIEEIAEAEGRTYLTLGTEAGSGAESVYPRLGWTKYGVLPGYMITPGPKYELKDEICYYKKLPSHGKKLKLPTAEEARAM
ncbi:acyl-CoA N-acyltransferase [Schizophyllum commune Tattone D]|nr:acyl-CoA N-acyltransferase [Schizophyllum commune Tattone D]